MHVVTKVYNRERKKYCSGEGIERNIRTILHYSTQERKRFTNQAQANNNNIKDYFGKNILNSITKTKLFS